MDYLDNPLPGSIAVQVHVPPKKCGFRPAFTPLGGAVPSHSQRMGGPRCEVLGLLSTGDS